MLNDKAVLDHLISQLCSEDYPDVWNALMQLQEMGWLYDGSLRNIDVTGGNFFEAFMPEADISGANFTKTLLAGADLRGATCIGTCFTLADMHHVLLINAKMEKAEFQLAHLQSARIIGIATAASFRGASLEKATLEGEFGSTNFEGASLRGAHIEKAIFDEQTVLPDGSRWSPSTDLSKFTDESVSTN